MGVGKIWPQRCRALIVEQGFIMSIHFMQSQTAIIDDFGTSRLHR